MQTSELKRHAAGAAFWQVVQTAGDQALRMVLFVYTARVLEPREFGVFAIASIFVEYGRVLAKAGLSEALVQDEHADAELRDAIFWAVLGLTAIVAAALAASSWMLASLVRVPESQPFMVALAAAMLLGPLSATHQTMARRQFKNRHITAISLSASVAGSLTALGGLAIGWGLWSLVAQVAVGGMLSVILTWIAFPWIPRLRFSFARMRSAWRFSGHLLLARVMQMSVVRVQDLIAARFLGPASLGQFRVSGRAFEFMNSAFIAPLSSAAMPVLSRLQSNERAFQNAYGRMVALACLGACPAAFGFAAIAPDAVPVVFGERWMPAVPAMQVLSLLAPANALAYFAGPALAARGRPDVMVKVVRMQLIGTAILSLVAVQFGIVALAGAYVVRSYSTLPVQLRYFQEVTGMKPLAILSKIAPSTCAAAIMALVVVSARGSMGDWHVLVRIGVTTALGCATYLLVLVVFFRAFVKDQVGALRDLLPVRRA